MTAPTTEVKPTRWKSIIALVGSMLSWIIPLLIKYADLLPPPWPAVIGGVVALLTFFGVYQAPYRPPGTVLVPTQPAATNPPPPVPDAPPWKA